MTTESVSETPVWLRSSICDTNACVEVAFLANGNVLMRNSADPDGTILAFTKAEWVAFVGDETGGAKGGEFDVKA